MEFGVRSTTAAEAASLPLLFFLPKVRNRLSPVTASIGDCTVMETVTLLLGVLGIGRLFSPSSTAVFFRGRGEAPDSGDCSVADVSSSDLWENED